MSIDPQKKLLACVLSGGGARGAYEAGVIHYIRTQLPKELAHRRPFDILCGSSVGSLNICFQAATNHNLEFQGKKMYELWHGVKQEDIYLRGFRSFTRLLVRTMGGVLSNFFKKPEVKIARKRFGGPHFKGFLDTTPFIKLLYHIIPWQQISLNMHHQVTKAVSLTATNVHTGKVEFFIQKHPSLVYSGRQQAHFVEIEPRHALASAAIPLLFPTVKINNHHYCDGGLRLNTPLSPAIHLGAHKVLVVGLHHTSERAQQKKFESVKDIDASPTFGEVIGQVMKTIFVDRLEYDLAQLRRINTIIDTGEMVYGGDFLEKMNQKLYNQEGQDIAMRGLNKIDFLSIFPSVDIRKVFRECVDQADFMKRNLTYFERFLLRVLDVDLKQGLDFLTFILFVPSYMQRLLELGYEDAKAQHDQLVQFFACPPSSSSS